MRSVSDRAAVSATSCLRFSLLGLVLLAAVEAQAAGVLDQRAQLARWTWWDQRDWDWYERTSPFCESPDQRFDQTYYYRWELVNRHLVYASAADGYVVGEFLDRPHGDRPLGVSCAALGRQLAELRWARDRRYSEDFARWWSIPASCARGSSNWYAHAVWGLFQVSGERAFLRQMVPHLIRHYDGWMAERWDPQTSLFRCSGRDDGMDTNINSRQTGDPFAGATAYRPTLNSYLYGDLSALAAALSCLDDAAGAERFARAAAALRTQVQQALWDPQRRFFFPRSAFTEACTAVDADQTRTCTIPAGSLTHQAGRFAGSPHGRELIGYLPWQFHLPEPGRGFEAAWQGAADPTVFHAAYGLTTVERRDPLFRISDDSTDWSGNSHPALTSQVLTAMANVLHDYPQDVLTRAHYLTALTAYTQSHQRAGRPFIADTADPDRGTWLGHDTDHGDHHFNSTYVDLIISGLVGLRPRADEMLEINPLAPPEWSYWCLDEVVYHGHRLSILWDRDGSRYGRGSGLVVLVGGAVLAARVDLGRILVRLPERREQPRVQPLPSPEVNVAVNHGSSHHPRMTASHTVETERLHNLQDGRCWYQTSPHNRWTARGSTTREDWIALDLGTTRAITRVTLGLLDDGEGSEVRAPAAYELTYWNGYDWVVVPDQQRTPPVPCGGRANVITFPALQLRHLRLQLCHRPGSCSGLSEWEVWSPSSSPFLPPPATNANLALADAQRGLPRVTTSFTAAADRLDDVNDGRTPETPRSRDRWTARHSPNLRDWIAFDFGGDCQLGRVELHVWGDGGYIHAPRAITLERWDGRAWQAIPQTTHTPALPVANQLTTITFPPLICRHVRVVFTHALPAFAGVSEIAMWEQ